MTNRYFVAGPIGSERAVIDGPEAHHLLHVMRSKVGDQVVLFDGSGWEFSASVAKLGRSSVELDVLSRADVNRELPFELTLGVALPKGDRQRWLIEKAVELGVTRVVPLITQRGVAQPNATALDRLRRAVVEASKQCGRNRLMTIEAPSQLADYVLADSSIGRRWIAHPDGESQSVLAAADSPAFLAIGPEGGFTDEEVVAALAANWQLINLGPRTLRIETAAIALVSRLTCE